jgi:hypothetical protein
MDRHKNSFWRNNALSIVFLLLAILTLLGEAFTGWQEHNDHLREHHIPAIDFSSYLHSGHFIQATFENWESEFFQMGLFVILTAFLVQRGSSESKGLDEPSFDPQDLKAHRYSPWPVKKGGIWLWVYKYSLSIALFLLFVASFILHWYGSWKDYNFNQALDNMPGCTLIAYLSNKRLWFESFQNWQSEFLSIFAIIYLSIYLRQWGSSQSKPVNMAHPKNKPE